MGYYAWGSGDISFAELLNKDTSDAIEDVASEVFSLASIREYYDETGAYSILDLDFEYDKYHDDDVWDVLEQISGIAEVRDAYITFYGEDDCFWKFVYKDGEWDDVVGDVVFQDEKFSDITDEELIEECHRRNIIGQLYVEVMDFIN